MAFNDVYRRYTNIISNAAKDVEDGRQLFKTYVANGKLQVQEAAIASGRQVIIDDEQPVISSRDTLQFKWRFWDGLGQFNTGNPGDLKLRGAFSWSPSAPDLVVISGTGIDDDEIDLEKFVQDELLTHVVTLMDEVLNAQAEKAYPHLR